MHIPTVITRNPLCDDHDDTQRVHVPTEIHIPVGRPVEIALETRDVIHSFWVPKLHTIRFVAED